MSTLDIDRHDDVQDDVVETYEGRRYLSEDEQAQMSHFVTEERVRKLTLDVLELREQLLTYQNTVAKLNLVISEKDRLLLQYQKRDAQLRHEDERQPHRDWKSQIEDKYHITHPQWGYDPDSGEIREGERP